MTEIAKNAQSKPAFPQVGLLISGEWIYDRPACGQVYNPSDESVLGSVPGATDDDLDQALKAAQKGFEEWRKVPPEERSDLLRRTAALMRERADEIAATITLEQGKPFTDARREVDRSASFLDWDSEQLKRSYGRTVPSPHPLQQYVVKEPIGPVAAFTPWNVPVSAAGRKLSGSIAAGCSVIIKPATQTPASTCLMAQCFLDAGLPKDAICVIHGKSSHISERLILSPVIQMITLTGSVEVGKTLTRLAAEGVKPVLMELGGHAPVLIGGDVNPAKVAELAAKAKFFCGGQICVSPSRFLVHRDVYEDFVTEFASRARALRVGDGFAEDTQMGPLASARQVDTISELVDDAVKRGARVAAGGERLGNQGWFYAPTVLGEVPRDARIMHEEPFGPAAPCVMMDDMDEALEVANGLEVGLAGYIFTNDVELGDRLSNGLQCGSVAVNVFTSPGPNAPFGGHKESGIGVEGGMESLDSYSISKTISHNKVRI